MSDYYAGLRRRLGSSLLIMPTVAVLPRDEHGRVLLVRQSETGRWDTIGGAVEPDEAPEAAAAREAAEEASVTVSIGRLVAAVGGPGYRITYSNGDEVACVSMVYEAAVLSGEPAPDRDETTEVGWFTLAEAAALELGGMNRQLLDDILDRL